MHGMRTGVALGVALLVGAGAAWGDFGVFVSTVDFDPDANLGRAPGVGLRWGGSSGVIGGETCVMVARPDRNLGTGSQTTTALFYEGRVLFNFPTGLWRPFVGVGLGAVTLTSTNMEMPANADAAVATALNAVSDFQTNTSVSYGGGVRYVLSDRFHLRADVRQYLVFSVKGIVADRLAQEMENQTGVSMPDHIAKDSTVQYNELSVGVSILF